MFGCHICKFICLKFPHFVPFRKAATIVFVNYCQALDTLGNTKWRVNKRVLSVVDRIWASGGRLADLVDRNDVSYIMLLIFLSFLL